MTKMQMDATILLFQQLFRTPIAGCSTFECHHYLLCIAVSIVLLLFRNSYKFQFIIVHNCDIKFEEGLIKYARGWRW